MEKEVAVVWGAEQGVGRALALAMGARGVSVVVAGADERSLGRVVGELVCGGGRARHVVGKAGDSGVLTAAVAKAREAFGEVTSGVMVSSDRHETTEVIGLLRQVLPLPARLLVVDRAEGTSDPPGRLAAPHDELLMLAASTHESSERWVDMALFLLFSEPARPRRLLIG
jgi:NAD(P)-dependent dehydrogenase (short-subunit alcohol dehydrogenase family)